MTRRLALVFFAVLVSGLVLGGLTSCQSQTPKPELPTAKRASDPKPSSTESNLTRIEAERRSAVIGSVAYSLSIDLDPESEWFKGEVEISFEKKTDEHDALFVDFKNGGAIEKMSVNATSVDPASFYVDHRIQLPRALLKQGANKVLITYRQKFSKNGRGFYRFKDPEDSRVYVFTHFEPFDANHFFPSFDQPDLKATLKLKVVAPRDWKVISTMSETQITPAGESRSNWEFPETPRLSTYLFALHAGPYHQWSSKAGDIPLRLFARQSMARFVVPQDWFTPTIQGMKFFDDYFQYPYPFHKYDQVIVPDFNSGAMENVAAVTFSERFVTRGKATRDERMDLADVILHELAHHWFGNLVTMQWWDGLWLNESFATYMASHALAEATDFKEAWIDFHYSTKSWAYTTDQQVTTHPIQGEVPDTQGAFANFDGITYGKGASVLKQLGYFLGGDKFRDGLRIYFKRHAYQNTKISDFLKALEDGSGRELGSWSQLWLETSGADTLEARYECAGGKVRNFHLHATPAPGQSVLRPHRTLVGLFADKAGRVELSHAVSVEYRDRQTAVPSLNGRACPVMVFPNYLDHDYVKVRLDGRTLEFAKKNLSRVKETFARMLFYPNLFEMVRDGELLPQDYLDIVVRNFPSEMDPKISDSLGRSLAGFRRSGLDTVIYFLPRGTPATERDFAKRVAAVEKVLLRRLERAAPGSDFQSNAFDLLFTGFAQSKLSMNLLDDVLSGKKKFRGLDLDQDRRWGMIVRLSSLGSVNAARYLEKEKKRDASERGVQSALAAEAAYPESDVKKRWLDQLTMPRDAKDVMSLARSRAVLTSLFPAWQTALRAEQAERFYQGLLPLAQVREQSFLERYVSSVLPTLCTVESAERLKKFAADNRDRLPPTVIKTIRIGAQDDERCARLRERATAALAP